MRKLAEIAPGVMVATAALYTTTSTVVVGNGASCLVVDPAVSAAEVTGLAGELAARALRPCAGWATHPHWDHVLWCAELGDVPRYATAPAAAAADRNRARLLTEVADEAPGHDLNLVGRLTVLAGSPSIPWDGPTVRVLQHDGHEVGHGALFLPDTGTLLAGDMLSDVEIPLLASGPDPIGRYLAGLELLAGVDGVRAVVPGHGQPGDHAEFRRRIAADLRYLDRLGRGDASAGDDERIGAGWLRVAHNRQFALLTS